MSRKTPLTCQSNRVCIVIRKNKDIPQDVLKRYCDDNFELYAFVEHKNHTDPVTKMPVPVHYHIVGNMKGTKTPFSTRLNTIARFFHFDNLHGIEIDKYNTLEGSIQYLTHKNQKDKTQVPKENIVTNIDPTDFDIYYNAEIGNIITFDMIYTSCKRAKNIIDVIKDLGLSNYRTYRNVVLDIFKSIHSLPL